MTPAGPDDDGGQAAARQARLDSYEHCREVRLWGHHSRPLGDTVGTVVWCELRDPPERHPASS